MQNSQAQTATAVLSLSLTDEELYALSANYHAAKDIVGYKAKPSLEDYQTFNRYADMVEELVFNPINSAYGEQFEAAMCISEAFHTTLSSKFTREVFATCSAHQARLQKVCERVTELSGRLSGGTLTVWAWVQAQAQVRADMESLIKQVG